MNFLDADYSAIEARITCWLAEQEDALQEYRDNVDRYKVMASVIYRVPQEQVNKHPQRFVGKQATLGCGFGMGPPKFRATCWKMGRYKLPEGLEYTAVKAWRGKHKKVVSYWYDMERAAKNAILRKGEVFAVRERIKFQVRDVEGMEFLLMRLPSGRKLAYPKPRLCGDRIAFFGNVKGAVWGDISIWGGTFVENCLSGNTEVLSQHRGWISLHSVTTDDRLWDGEEFVSHEGLLNQGVQQVQEFHGLYATPDHKFLTVENSWVTIQTACTNPHVQLYSPNARQFQSKTTFTSKVDREEVWCTNGYSPRPRKWKENHLDLQVRLRTENRENWVRSETQESNNMWETMPHRERTHFGGTTHSWDEQTSCLRSVAWDDRSVQLTNPSSVAQLWSTRDFCLQTMEEIRELLEGHGTDLPKWVGHRPQEQQWELHTQELLVDHTKAELQKPKGNFTTSGCSSRFLGRGLDARNQEEHAVLPYQSGTELGSNHQHPTRFSEQVYDIKNCGPRQRFAVRGRTGQILIAHNCVQAVAADIMAHGAHNAERENFEIATLVHDQALAYKKDGQTPERFVELLTDLPAWASGLPIAAEGSEVPFYRKE